MSNTTRIKTITPTGATLIVIAAAMAPGFTYVGLRLVRSGRLHRIVLGLVLSGALADLLDRIVHGYIRDFVWVPHLVIELAEVAIVTGVVAFFAGIYKTAHRGEPVAERV